MKIKNKKLKLYVVACYTKYSHKMVSIINTQELQGFIRDIEHIQFFYKKEDAEKLCDEWNSSEEFRAWEEVAKVEEYILNVKK